MLTGDLPYLGDNIMQLLQNIRSKDLQFPATCKASEELKQLTSVQNFRPIFWNAKISNLFRGNNNVNQALLKKSVAERISWEEFLSHPYIKGIPIRKSQEHLRTDDMKAKLRGRKREIKELRKLVETLKEGEEKADEALRALQESSEAQKVDFEHQKADWVKLMQEKTKLLEESAKRIGEMELFVERAKDEVRALKRTFANEDLKCQFETLRKEQEVCYFYDS